MISARGSPPALLRSAAASAIARTCIANRPGMTRPSRTPRRPSIGFCSCSRCTACSSRRSFSSRPRRAPRRRATRTDSSVRSGRNSCSGGSSSRTVTGRPSIASKMLDEVLALQRQQRRRAPRSRSSSVSARISRSTAARRSPRNMCSVRHRPMPCGAEAAGPGGVLGGVGVGAHAAAGARSSACAMIRCTASTRSSASSASGVELALEVLRRPATATTGTSPR